MLARIFALNSENSITGFSDVDAVASWAYSSISAMVEGSYLLGADGAIMPGESISRKDFAVLMDRLVDTYVSDASDLTGDVIEGNIIITSPDVSLEGITVTGSIIIADGVDAGAVDLSGVTVEGDIIIRSSGTVTITDTTAANIIVADNTEDTEVIVAGDSTIENVTVSGADTTLEVTGDASVDTVVADGSGTTVTGDGTVGSVEANGNDTTVDTEGTDVAVAEDATGTTAGGESVEAGESTTTDTTPSTSTGSSGGGTSATKYTVIFDDNDSDETTSIPSITGTSVTLPKPTRTDYAFAGWNTVADGSGTFYAANQTVTENLTLYAIWGYGVASQTEIDTAVANSKNPLVATENFVLGDDTSSFTAIPEGTTLYIPSDVTLTVADGNNANIIGTLVNNGTLVVEGNAELTLSANSQFMSNGTLTNHGTIMVYSAESVTYLLGLEGFQGELVTGLNYLTFESITVPSGVTLSGNFTVTGSLTIDEGGTWVYDYSTIEGDATVTNNGTIEIAKSSLTNGNFAKLNGDVKLNNDVTVSENLVVQSGVTLDTNGKTLTVTGYLTSNGTIINTGTIDITGTSLTNNTTITNEGKIKVNTNLVNGIKGDITNSGTIEVTGGLTNNGEIINNGFIDVTGTTNGNGNITTPDYTNITSFAMLQAWDALTGVNAVDGTITGSFEMTDNITVANDRTLTVAEGATLTIGNDKNLSISANGSFINEGAVVNGGTILVYNEAALKTALAIGGKVTVKGDIVVTSGMTAAANTELTISQNITLTIGGNTEANAGSLIVASGTLTIGGAGTLAVTDYGSISNSGTIKVSDATTLATVLAKVSGGTVYMTGDATIDGTLTVPSGVSLWVTDGTTTVGTLTVNGTVSASGTGAIEVTGSITGSGELRAYTTIILGANCTLDSSVTYVASSSASSFVVNSDAQFSTLISETDVNYITVASNVAYTGDLVVKDGATLTINNGTLVVSGDINNDGTITNSGSLYITSTGKLQVTTCSLLGANGAKIYVFEGGSVTGVSGITGTGTYYWDTSTSAWVAETLE